MKKFIAFVAVCGFALTFVACGQKAENQSSVEVDSAATAPVETVVADSTTTAADTTAAQ